MTVEELAAHYHHYKLFSSSVGSALQDAKGGKFMAALATAWGQTAFECGKGLSNENHLYPAGGSQPHENLAPSVAVYAWRRQA